MEKHTFKVKQDLVLENSFGIVDSEDEVELEITVGINTPEYGWFELYDTETEGDKWYAEGGLWFVNKVLTDYDGVFELIPPILEKLTELGYDCSEVV